MPIRTTEQILHLCLGLDCRAVNVYRVMAQRLPQPHLRQLCEMMVKEEMAHVAFWKDLIASCADGQLPNLFPEPGRVVAELEAISLRVDHLQRDLDGLLQRHHPLVVALRLEFFLLHPAVMLLLRYLRDIQPRHNPLDGYDRHLRHLLDAMAAEPDLALEAELLGEAVHHLCQSFEMSATAPLRDPLTGLLNRQGLAIAREPLLGLARRNGQHAGILLFDIDKLYLINETWGSAQGDAALCQVGSVIRRSLRHADVIGRYGGDEFLAVLSPVDPAGLEAIVEKVRQELQDHPALPVPLTLSVGAACGLMAAATDRTDELLLTAERALQAVRGKGRFRLVILP